MKLIIFVVSCSCNIVASLTNICFYCNTVALGLIFILFIFWAPPTDHAFRSYNCTFSARII